MFNIQNIICINCYKRGHTFKDCVFPVTSYGVIAYKWFDKELKFLLVQRKDSIGYIDFIRGKYSQETLRILIGEMTFFEKQRILSLNYDQLWSMLWINHNSRAFKNDYYYAKKKFDNINVLDMISDSLEETKWNDSEYCIAKGRRNNCEPEKKCALREFKEETGFKENEISINNSLDKIEEQFLGSNGISYKHVYYIGEIFTDRIPKVDQSNILQAGEIKSLNWFSYKEAMNIFRNYDTTKRAVIHQVNKILTSELNTF